MDWDAAEEHLKLCEEVYKAVGGGGYFTINFVIQPLKDRINQGERTEELYNEIMNIKL